MPTIDDLLTRKTLSIGDACELAQVSRRSIYNWLEAGKLEYTRTAGGCIRIFVDSLFTDQPSDARLLQTARARQAAVIEPPPDQTAPTP